jgi:hypothetical protein
MLDTLAGDVRTHLELAARVLADLRPAQAAAHTAAGHRPPEQRKDHRMPMSHGPDIDGVS